jgi:hypothetical protein
MNERDNRVWEFESSNLEAVWDQLKLSNEILEITPTDMIIGKYLELFYPGDAPDVMKVSAEHVHKIVDSFVSDALHELTMDGLVEPSIGEGGEVYYSLTDEGQEAIKDDKND